MNKTKFYYFSFKLKNLNIWYNFSTITHVLTTQLCTMKKALLIILLACVQQLYAQKASPALSKSYSKIELQQIESLGNGTVETLNYGVDHACYIIQTPEGKDVSQFPTIAIKSKKELHFTDLHLQIKDRTQYFKIEGSNELLVVKSLNILKLEMQNQK